MKKDTLTQETWTIDAPDNVDNMFSFKHYVIIQTKSSLYCYDINDCSQFVDEIKIQGTGFKRGYACNKGCFVLLLKNGD